MTARQFKVWILVRKTNPKALPFVGRSGYSPKRIDCKAKTATFDAGGKRIGGLVADPTRWPAAFSNGRRHVALSLWWNFATRNGLYSESAGDRQVGYGIDTEEASQHVGCVTFNGDYIHSDYDLFDIVVVGQANHNIGVVRKLHGEVDVRSATLIPLRDFINRRLGVEMIQHGAAAQVTMAYEDVDAFGPNGEAEYWRSTDVRRKYVQWRRRLLGGGGDGSELTSLRD